tara:strand:- start:1225 stop:1908 length:684 start_codon:yes stop_codon:yes gene_type:complete
MNRKLIIITGVTRGLGRALSDQYLKMGHTVIGCGRNAEIIKKMSAKYPTNTDFQALDVSDYESVIFWANRIIKSFGSPDFLLNNAGIMNDNRNLWEVSKRNFSEVVDTNIKGIFNTVKGYVPEMINQKRGIIVNFSSGWGRTTSPKVAPYCTSKWAVEGLTKSLAQELPQGLSAVALSPGVIDTDMLRLCWGNSASAHEKPETWAQRVAPYILKISSKDNGASITTP